MEFFEQSLEGLVEVFKPYKKKHRIYVIPAYLGTLYLFAEILGKPVDPQSYLYIGFLYWCGTCIPIGEDDMFDDYYPISNGSLLNWVVLCLALGIITYNLLETWFLLTGD